MNIFNRLIILAFSVLLISIMITSPAAAKEIKLKGKNVADYIPVLKKTKQRFPSFDPHHVSEVSTRFFKVKGMPVTGVNEYCGQPIWRFPTIGAPVPQDFHGAAMGSYNPAPDATEALALSPSNCSDDLLLVSTTDLDFVVDLLGFPDMDSRMKNIPFRDVAIIVDPSGLRDFIPSTIQRNPLPPSKNVPSDPITLGKWRMAKGDMKINCKADGTAKVKFKFKNLIPNGMYSMWAVWKTTPPGADFPSPVPQPLGGVPNAVVSDKKGSAKFERMLAWCPMDPTPDGSEMLLVVLAYHSDGNIYGSVPEPSLDLVDVRAKDGTIFSTYLPPGAMLHDHMDFVISPSAEYILGQ